MSHVVYKLVRESTHRVDTENNNFTEESKAGWNLVSFFEPVVIADCVIYSAMMCKVVSDEDDKKLNLFQAMRMKN